MVVILLLPMPGPPKPPPQRPLDGYHDALRWWGGAIYEY